MGTETTTFTMRVPTRFKEQLRKAAAAYSPPLSMAQYVRYACEQLMLAEAAGLRARQGDAREVGGE